MTWLTYVACFFSGMFLANAVPHFVQGVCGEPFPTPFAKPPGKGLSSAPVNCVWALFNMVVGYVLFRVEKVAATDTALIVFFAGVVAISIMMSINFQKKHAK